MRRMRGLLGIPRFLFAKEQILQDAKAWETEKLCGSRPLKRSRIEKAQFVAQLNRIDSIDSFLETSTTLTYFNQISGTSYTSHEPGARGHHGTQRVGSCGSLAFCVSSGLCGRLSSERRKRRNRNCRRRFLCEVCLMSFDCLCESFCVLHFALEKVTKTQQKQ